MVFIVDIWKHRPQGDGGCYAQEYCAGDADIAAAERSQGFANGSEIHVLIVTAKVARRRYCSLRAQLFSGRLLRGSRQQGGSTASAMAGCGGDFIAVTQ